MRKKLIIVNLFLGTIFAAQATTWSEIDDAGETTSSYQAPSGSGPLNSISGTLEDVSVNADYRYLEINYSTDVDLYQIYINDYENFSASTTAGSFEESRQLSLFDSNGFPVYTNIFTFEEDYSDPLSPSATFYPASLPANHPLGPSANGIYYLAIGSYEREAYSSNYNLMFDYPFGGIGGPNPDALEESLDYWPSFYYFPDTGYRGDYTISLTGTNYATTIVPEPSIYAMIIGALTFGYLIVLRHRRV